MSKPQHIPETLQQSLQELAAANIHRDIEPGKDLIQAAAPTLGAEDLLFGVNALVDGWLTEGKYCRSFEKEIAGYVGNKYVALVNSGSSANLLAFAALCSPKLGERAIQKGDEVITVAAGFPTTVNPIIQYGCIPVFIDIDIPTYNIDSSLIESAITSKTKAIVMAHSLGNAFDLGEVKRLAEKHNLWLIEDNCDALGCTYNGKMTGSFGDLATLSFFPAHHITTGEGGAVMINNAKLKKIVESLRSWGRDCWCAPGADNTCGIRFEQKHADLPEGYDHKYVFSHIGYNMKMAEVQAAIGLSQIKKIDTFVEARRKHHKMLKERFSEFEEFFILPEATPNSNPSWFGFSLTCREGIIDRNDLCRFLNERKVGTRLFFAGNLLKHPAYQGIDHRIIGSLERTDQVMLHNFWLGVWPGLQEKHLDYMYESVAAYLKKEGHISKLIAKSS